MAAEAGAGAGAGAGAVEGAGGKEGGVGPAAQGQEDDTRVHYVTMHNSSSVPLIWFSNFKLQGEAPLKCRPF